MFLSGFSMIESSASPEQKIFFHFIIATNPNTDQCPSLLLEKEWKKS